MPFLLALLALIALNGGAPGEKIPFFSRLTAESAGLHSYTVPVHTGVTIHKLLTFHLGLNGTVYFKQPNRVALDMRMVPEQYRRLFAELGTPRTWPQAYDMELTGTDTMNGRTVYHLKGVPRQPSTVDHMIVDLSDESAPIVARWFLRAGGTIKSTIDSQLVGSYVLPKRQQADIAVDGFKIHADMTYGDYALNSEVSNAVF